MIRAYDDNGNVIDIAKMIKQIKNITIDEFVFMCEYIINDVSYMYNGYLTINDIKGIAKLLKGE